jgi:hypothetical protein
MFEGKFRGGTVVVKIERELDAKPQNNAAMREVVARGGKYGEFGLQLFASLLPFNEKHAIEEGIPELDVLQIQISRGMAYAVIEEPHTYRAEVVFDALAERWREKPSEETVRDTAGLLLAVLTLLSALHSREGIRRRSQDVQTFDAEGRLWETGISLCFIQRANLFPSAWRCRASDGSIDGFRP